MRNYAILLSAGNAELDGYDEFWNDSVMMYNVLTNPPKSSLLKFTDENIYVLYGTGTDYLTDVPKQAYSQYSIDRNSNRAVLQGMEKRGKSAATTVCQFTDYPANMDNIKNLFQSLQGVSDINTLFIWTFGHGFRQGRNSWLFLGDGEKLFDYELANLVSSINCNTRIICLQQCFSGGFINFLKNDKKNIIMSSCADTEFSYRSDKEYYLEENRTYNHAEFTYHIHKAMKNPRIIMPAFKATDPKKPLKTKGLGKEGFEKKNLYVKASETATNIFKYANKNDNASETPQYYDLYNNLRRIPQLQDYLRVVWSIGNSNDDLKIEFAYPVTDMFKNEQDKEIHLFIDGVLVHTFTIENKCYIINQTPSNKFGLIGKFEANYYQRCMYYRGRITGKASHPYCPAHNYTGNLAIYPEMDSESGLKCHLPVFNWI